MSLSFKNRIAFHYMIATAIIMAMVFSAIYFTVQGTVINNLDHDLSYEAVKHANQISFKSDSLQFADKAEWEEREHREIQVNPVFIQILDKDGKVMDKSPNLKEDHLIFKDPEFGDHFYSELNNRSIRQVQLPLKRNGEVKGYVSAAISSESAKSILLKLRNTLIISYLLVLLGLYFVSRFLAGRSIKPIQEVTKTITRITKNNLKERVLLPQNKDEIYVLSTSFNDLLERIENAIDRERQFTSDASHELRTPLATLRGTLEVLIRKDRTQQEYEDKIKYSLAEISRMTVILEQLLLLARLDTKINKNESEFISLPTIVDESLTHNKSNIANKNLAVKFLFDESQNLQVPNYYTQLIVNNIVNNAIKYSPENGRLTIQLSNENNHVVCTIEDEGIGIKKEDINHIYDNFFRSNSLNHKHISGNGLGLSIAKKGAEAIGAKLFIESEMEVGTKVTIKF